MFQLTAVPLGSRSALTECVLIYEYIKSRVRCRCGKTAPLTSANRISSFKVTPELCLTDRLASRITILCVMLGRSVFRYHADLLHRPRGSSSYTEEIIDLF